MPELNKELQRNISLPKVAVIIPCYNQGPYIQQAIESVITQDYPAKAVFVSDEGSTDDSYEKVRSMFEETQQHNEITVGKYKNTAIVLTKNPNPNGPSGARNRLIQMAWESSDLFSMLDADDYYLPGKISKSVKIMSADFETISIVYTDALIYNETGKYFIREYREPYSRQRLEQECIISNTPLLNKKVFSKMTHLYDETMRTAEDWDFWLRLTKNNIAIHIPEAMHVYRVTGKNASDVVPTEVWNANWQKIRQRINGKRD